MLGRRELIVVGNGMVGHRFVELLIGDGRSVDFNVTVVGEEPRPAYDRVGLSSFFAGKTADDLSLVAPGSYERAGIRPRDELGRASGLDLGERGGIEIDDRCRTSDPDIYAIGECAAYNDRVF